jgi:hypothetical protein
VERKPLNVWTKNYSEVGNTTKKKPKEGKEKNLNTKLMYSSA